MWHRLVEFLSAEFMLRRSNGGGVILARSLFTAIIVYVVAVATREALAPTSILSFSLSAARGAAYDTLPWFGAIFAGIYAAYYARFAAQWSYLAGLYNQIKAAEAQVADTEDPERASLVFAEWKAGFIEDAEELHLIEKRLFAGIVDAWLEDPLVRYSLEHDTKGGAKLLKRLLAKRSTPVAGLIHTGASSSAT
jgi:hypothetical protein